MEIMNAQIGTAYHPLIDLPADKLKIYNKAFMQGMLSIFSDCSDTHKLDVLETLINMYFAKG